jgi:hypothetical protein
MEYASNLSYFLGDEMAMPVNAVELNTKEVLLPENKDKFQKARDREIGIFREKRFVRTGDEKAKNKMFVPVDQLTQQQKDKALKCRFSFTYKRPELDQPEDEGKAKARLVAKDLKCIHQREKKETYAATPGIDAVRLMIASTEVEDGHELFSDDFDCAFLQSMDYEDERLVLIVYYDPFLRKDVYEWICGVIYGEQTGASDWKRALAYIFTAKMGFYEVKNMESMYHSTTREITASVHVDDPLMKSRSSEQRIRFCEDLKKLFDTKGAKLLAPTQALDYLSMRISMNEQKDIIVDNMPKLMAYLEEEGMAECNVESTPITRDIVRNLYKNLDNKETQTDAEQSKTGSMLGKAQWLSQTTHPTISPAVSMYCSILNKNVKGGLSAVKHLFRYLKGTLTRGLVKRAGCRTGMRLSTDADYAGLWSLGQGDAVEMRSRSGVVVKYNDMPVTWVSKFQNLKGTQFDERQRANIPGDTTRMAMLTPQDYTGPSRDTPDLLPKSTAESELYAASDGLEEGIKLKNICLEICVQVPSTIEIHIDALAAKGFIDNTGSGHSSMKHLDMKAKWIRMLRDRKEVSTVKVQGEFNEADFFTKIFAGHAFKDAEEALLPKVHNLK